MSNCSQISSNGSQIYKWKNKEDRKTRTELRATEQERRKQRTAALARGRLLGMPAPAPEPGRQRWPGCGGAAGHAAEQGHRPPRRGRAGNAQVESVGGWGGAVGEAEAYWDHRMVWGYDPRYPQDKTWTAPQRWPIPQDQGVHRKTT